MSTSWAQVVFLFQRALKWSLQAPKMRSRWIQALYFHVKLSEEDKQSQHYWGGMTQKICHLHSGSCFKDGSMMKGWMQLQQWWMHKMQWSEVEHQHQELPVLKELVGRIDRHHWQVQSAILKRNKELVGRIDRHHRQVQSAILKRNKELVGRLKKDWHHRQVTAAILKRNKDVVDDRMEAQAIDFVSSCDAETQPNTVMLQRSMGECHGWRK